MERLSELIMVRLTPEQKRAVRAKAKADGRPISNWSRRILVRAARDQGKGGSDAHKRT